MAFEIVWTERAIAGFDEVITYLKTHWTDREVIHFVNETQQFLSLLSDYPYLLQKTSKFKNVHRGPLNKLTMITYRVKVRKNQIEIINIRDARRKLK
ncbi:MAG: type II toxin-antitoxin system RelE/ParE family toxin [Bacteroidetes bacterium]|nr:type II toxin-antitoxin system RelE/ParE family toxin [Bacteroidota bacterium]MBI3483490.1 type II toxin-antitoxin system RelE/ParE family toxin [Bacteroidota bacterium]